MFSHFDQVKNRTYDFRPHRFVYCSHQISFSIIIIIIIIIVVIIIIIMIMKLDASHYEISQGYASQYVFSIVRINNN